MADKKESKKVQKAKAKRKHLFDPKFKKSKEHRHCGPIGYYLRTGIKGAKRG